MLASIGERIGHYRRGWLGAVTQPGHVNIPIAIFIVAILVAYVGMVYGPIGAFLAEFFPSRIRYTSVPMACSTRLIHSPNRSSPRAKESCSGPRFAGLDHDQAEAVCRTLKHSDISCITVRN
jgi:hypothetical protein